MFSQRRLRTQTITLNFNFNRVLSKMLNSFTNQLSKIKLPNNFDAFMKSEKQDQLAVVGIAGNNISLIILTPMPSLTNLFSLNRCFCRCYCSRRQLPVRNQPSW